MRLASLLYELLLILLFALLCYWVAQHFLRPIPFPLEPQVPVPSQTTDTQDEPLPFPTDIAPSLPPKLRPKPPEHIAKLINSVYEQTKVTRSYDPAYVKLAYPNGDVDQSTGVCTDVVIRAFRAQGIDLQKRVHEDMRKAFKNYPRKWGLRTPDTNIDHRRVPNLMTYFDRQGKALPVTEDPDNYKSGDLVVWELPSGQEHIGVVLAERSNDEARPLIGHNVGEGANVDDVLFAWPIRGHYRYFEPKLADNADDANAK
ncbi:MAG: DUF1287 domain-containing protein [Thiolinea sp.]